MTSRQSPSNLAAQKDVCAVGALIRQHLADLDPPQSQMWLAAKAGIGSRHLSQVMRGFSRLTAETAVKLERVGTGLDAIVLLDKQTSEEVMAVRRRYAELIDPPDPEAGP